MTRARRCWGWRSRSAAIVGLQEAGWTEGRIAKQLKIKPNTVSSLASRYRARHVNHPPAGQVMLDGSLYVDLRNEASRRETDVDALIHRLLLHAINGKLVDAILDEDD